VRRVLVFGGTRYFGKKLVDLLLKNGDQVTIATRGKVQDKFGNLVSRITVDRSSISSLNEKFSNSQVWDVIYDNICYSSNDAKITVDLFKDKVKKYVFTSTMSVYGPGEKVLIEDDFKSTEYPIKMLNRSDVDYGEGKRMAESYFIQNVTFPVVAPRFPIVLGLDDYTKRLHFHIERILKGQEIGFQNTDAKISFITSEEVAEFLLWVGQNDVVGPINACSSGEMVLGDIISIIENETGEKANVIKDLKNESSSPFSLLDHWIMSNERAREAGFSFKEVNKWFPELVHDIYRENL
jgi:nucleoside-diphosphate-sugar epimerase